MRKGKQRDNSNFNLYREREERKNIKMNYFVILLAIIAVMFSVIAIVELFFNK